MRPITHAKSQVAGHGFTLIEVMVTMAIVAIVAAVAMPSYKDYVLRGKLTQAYSTLSGIGVNLQQYYQDNRTFVNSCGNTGLAALPAATADFTFACPTLTATSFSATAAGNSGSAAAGFTFTLDHNGKQATSNVPTGWTASSSCWVRTKSGSCN